MLPEPALQVNQRVTVSLLTTSRIHIPARVLRVAAGRIELGVQEPMPSGEAVQVEGPDCMLLGTILSVRPSADGYTVLLGMEHRLRTDLDTRGWWTHKGHTSPLATGV